MHYTALGKTQLHISRLGFGGIPIQRTTREETKKVLRYLMEHGVNYIDTARGYTVSEEYIGYALEGIRDRFVIATKSMARTREGMQKDIAISMEKLRTDYIELYQVHNPSPEELEQVIAPGGALEALQEAKREGRIGHIGITLHSVALFEKALEYDWVETIMFPYNLIESQGKQCIDACVQKNIGFIAMKPLAGGAIDDAQLAISYVINDPAVSVVIPGMATVEEAQQNIAASEPAPLTAQQLEKAEALRKQLGSRFCRRCNYCAPCTAGLQISALLLLEGYYNRYGLKDWAIQRYNAMPVKATDCVGCGLCEIRCPYQLPIREMLRSIGEEFG